MKLKDCLGLLVVCSFLVYAFAVTFIPHESDLELINIVIGWLGAKASTIIDFKYGSSEGSKAKNDIISKLKND